MASKLEKLRQNSAIVFDIIGPSWLFLPLLFYHYYRYCYIQLYFTITW